MIQAPSVDLSTSTMDTVLVPFDDRLKSKQYEKPRDRRTNYIRLDLIGPPSYRFVYIYSGEEVLWEEVFSDIQPLAL